jgi:hypothetical protein
MAILECGITGSLPKPQWLSDPTAPLRAEWILEGDRLDEARDDAVRLAIADQEAAGLDIVTDGEQRVPRRRPEPSRCRRARCAPRGLYPRRWSDRGRLRPRGGGWPATP